MRIAICDDNIKELASYSKVLSQFIEKHKLTGTIIEKYESGDDLLKEWKWDKQSILFLDIYMPGTKGVDVAKVLREQGYEGKIIFLTASTKEVFDAFDVDAFHYLVKGTISQQKIEEVFLNVFNYMNEDTQRYITLSRGGDIRNVPLKSISHFELKNRITTVYYDDESFAFYSPLERIEKMLEGEGFVRIHRAYIVAISKINRYENKELQLVDGANLPISSKYQKNLQMF